MTREYGTPPASEVKWKARHKDGREITRIMAVSWYDAREGGRLILAVRARRGARMASVIGKVGKSTPIKTWRVWASATEINTGANKQPRWVSGEKTKDCAESIASELRFNGFWIYTVWPVT